MMGQAVAIRALTFLQHAAPPVQGPIGPFTDQQFRQQLALEAMRNGWAHHAPDILVPIALFTMVAVVVWLAVRGKQARIRAQAELQKHLLDKFASGQEFAAFLESKGGQKFLNELWSPRANARERMARSLSAGVILSALGVGCLVLAFFAGHQHGLIVPAVILLALGVGFLIVAYIANRLSKQWAENPQSGPVNP